MTSRPATNALATTPVGGRSFVTSRQAATYAAVSNGVAAASTTTCTQKLCPADTWFVSATGKPIGSTTQKEAPYRRNDSAINWPTGRVSGGRGGGTCDRGMTPTLTRLWKLS